MKHLIFSLFTFFLFTATTPTDNVIVLKKQNLKALSKSEDKVLIYVWASWCAPCVKKLPELVTQSNQGKKIIFISIEEDATKCYALLQKNGFEGQHYALNPKEFKLKRADKIQDQIKKLFDVGDDPHFGVPQNYFFKNGGLVTYTVGDFDLGLLE